MNGKFAILLVLAAAAQSSLAQNASESCLNSTSSIKSDLAIIEYGQRSSLTGLRNMEDAIYEEIVSSLSDRTWRKRGNSKNTNVRFEQAKKTAFDNLMLGIEPTLLAIKVYQPNIDVSGLLGNSTAVCHQFIDLIFSAINLIQVSKNYTASQAELETYADDLVPRGTRLIQGLYGSLFRGSTPIPEASGTVLGCVAVKAKAHILDAMASVADQVAVALAAVHNIGTKNALQTITAIHQEARSDFDTEVLWKYSLIRNLVVGAYLKNSTDIVTGLFDVLSTVPGYTSI